MKDVLIKIACLFGLLLWAGSIVCGIVLFIKTRAFVPILSFAVLAFMSFPTAVIMFERLTDK